ncbi:unnamed protein product [Prorocentrum cordatum]|uniref:Uncharacterized protein n=1 Tax=Prorocentrum cordatum TaxID=2364126 RepID=A0ABN9W232_9DINO|nr:unnamed protein product [Polarella glacialis]
MQMLMPAARRAQGSPESATGTQRRLTSPDDAPSVRIRLQSSAEEVRVLGAMQVPASLHAFDFRIGFGEVRLDVSALEGGTICSLFVPETDLRPGFGGNIELDLRIGRREACVLRQQLLDLLLGAALNGTLRAEGRVSGPRSEGRARFEVPMLLALAGLPGSVRLGDGGGHAVLSLSPAELLGGGDDAASPAPSPAPPQGAAGARPELDECDLSLGTPSLLRLEVVGGGEAGQPLVLPCLQELGGARNGQECPDGSAGEGPFEARLAVEFAARLPCLLRMPYVLELPALRAQVAGGALSESARLVQVSTEPFSYKSQEDEWSRMELEDQAFEVYTDGDSGSLLDSLLSVLHVELELSSRVEGIVTWCACAWQDVKLWLTNEHGQAIASVVEGCSQQSDGAVVYGTVHGYAGKHIVQQVFDTFVLNGATSRVIATANFSYTTSLGRLQSIVLPASISRTLVDELGGSSCRRLSQLLWGFVEPLRSSRESLSSGQAWNEVGRRLSETQEPFDIGEMKNDFSKMLEQGVVSVDSVWNIGSMLFSDVEVILENFAINNILAFGIGIHSVDVKMSMNDVDGAMWLLDHYGPAFAFQFAHVVLDSDLLGDFFVDAAHKRVFPEFVVTIPSDYETLVRLYDEVVERERLCANVDVVITAFLQSPGQDAYVLEELEIGMTSVDARRFASAARPLAESQKRLMMNAEVYDEISLGGATTVGSATLVGGAVELASTYSDGGAIWSVSRVAVADSWEATFEFKVSEYCWFVCASVGGYGFAFVLQDGPSDAAANGDDDGGGYSGIDNSIGVLLYTRYNVLGFGNELYVYKNGATSSGDELATATLPEGVSDGSWQSAKVVYSAASGRMWVYVRDMEVALTTFQVDMDFADENGQAHVGFTASNPSGGGISTFVIRDLVFKGAATSVQHSRITEDGLAIGPAGSSVSFTLLSYTSCDRQRLSGGDSWLFDLVKGSEILSLAPESSVTYSIRDDGDGTYTVEFLAASAGTWTVKGTISPGATKQVERRIPGGSEELGSFTMVGSAEGVGGAVELASAVSDGGATWSVSRVAVVDNWAATFEFKVSVGEVCGWFLCTSDGGYGFAFVLQSGPSDAAASGDDGGGGYSGIDNSIGVLLYTYETWFLGNDLYVYKNGATSWGDDLATAPLPDGVRDGSWQSAKVTYSAASGRMWVYVQDMEVALATLQVDMDFADGNGMAHVGFTASNSGGGFSSFKVRNLVFETATPC